MTVEEQLQQMKKAIDYAKDMKYRAELKLESLEKQKENILLELEQLGVKPEELEDEITRLEQEITSSLKEAWNLIPKELTGDGK